MKDKQINSSTLLSYSVFGFPLAFSGLPLYIYLPKFTHDHFGISLALIGLILLLSRLLDAFISPLLGILSDRFGLTHKKFFILFGGGLVVFFNSYFYLPTSASEFVILSWFCLATILIYCFFSLLYVNFYSLGVSLGSDDFFQTKLSSFRESFGFLGMIVASVFPAILIHFLHDEVSAFKIFGLCFAGVMVIALWVLPQSSKARQKPTQLIRVALFVDSLKQIFKNHSMRQLIIVFFINSLPVAISANLFSFYVEQSLMAKDSSPIFLLCCLFSSAISAVLCSIFLKNANKVYALLWMMGISVISFACTYFITQENNEMFFLVCILSGFGIGGEVVILPIIAARVLEKHQHISSAFFGVWTSCTKISLAVAAGIFLPLLSNGDQYFSDVPLNSKIAFFYTIIPLFIKCISIYLVFKFINHQQQEQVHAKS